MKNLIVCLIVAAFAAVPASAQTFGFGAHAGVSLPMGDYGDFAETGFSGGLDLLYPLAMAPGLGWYTSADVVAHSVEDEDDGFLYVPLMTGLRYDIGAGPIGVFLNGQLGWVFHNGPDDGDEEAEWGSNFGCVLGGGARITDNFYAGIKYYPLSLDFQWEGDVEAEDVDVDFLDIYIGFGVF